MELEGCKGLVDTGKSSHTWVTYPFPLFRGLEWVLGLFWSKNVCF